MKKKLIEHLEDAGNVGISGTPHRVKDGQLQFWSEGSDGWIGDSARGLVAALLAHLDTHLEKVSEVEGKGRPVRTLADLEGHVWCNVNGSNNEQPHRVKKGKLQFRVDSTWRDAIAQSMDAAFNTYGAPRYLPSLSEPVGGGWKPVQIKSIDDLDKSKRYKVCDQEFFYNDAARHPLHTFGYLVGCIDSGASFEEWTEPVTPKEVTLDVVLGSWGRNPSLCNTAASYDSTDQLLAKRGFKAGDKVEVTVRAK